MKKCFEERGIYCFFKDIGEDFGLKDMWFFFRELY